MVDEVEIKNVGGKNGVASEATLAALVASLNSGGVSREKIAKLEALARSANTKKITEESKQRGILGKAFSGLASSAGGLIKEFAAGGDRMGDFSAAVFGAESSITGLVRAVDGLIDTYRDLTSVGASFNNSMYDFIKASAESGMTLSDYSSFILENSERIRMLGGTVTEGSKRFGEISKSLRQNFGPELSRVGMTLGDMNEILMEYTDFSIGRMGKETRTSFQMARGAAAYALELDKLSKLTGLNRKQLAEQMAQQQADQRVRVAMASMTEDQQENFNRALAVTGNVAPELKDALVDMADGIPNTEIAKKLMATSDTFRSMAGDIENMTTEDFAKFLRSMGQEVDQFSSSLGKGGMEALMASDSIFASIFGIGADLRRYSDMTDEQIAALEREQGSRDRLSETLLNFETALSNLRTFIIDEIVGSEAFKQLEELGKELATLFSDLFSPSGAANSAKEGFQSLTDTLIGPDGLVTNALRSFRDEISEFSTYLKNGGDAATYLKEGLANVTSSVYEWFKELFFGATKEIETPAGRRTVETQGIFGKMVDAFSEFWKSDTMVSIRNAVTDYFRDLVETIEDMFVNSTTLNALLGIDREEVAYRQATTGANIDVENALTAALGKGFWNTSELGGIESVGGQGVYNDLLAQLGDSADQYWTVNGKIEAALEELGRKYEEGTATEAERRLFADAIANLTNPNSTPVPAGVTGYDEFGSIPGNATGTVGFEDFGNESLRKLHGLEAVVPRNTQAGDYLSKYFTDDWRAKAQPVAPMNNTNNQEALTKQLSQLNNTMALVLSELKINNDLNKKTISSVKGLSGDLYRGV